MIHFFTGIFNTDKINYFWNETWKLMSPVIPTDGTVAFDRKGGPSKTSTLPMTCLSLHTEFNIHITSYRYSVHYNS